MVPPYIIQQVQLKEVVVEGLSFPLIQQSGYYCVFWWKDIALGHLFIECNSKHDVNEMLQKIIKAIEPGVDSYISKHKDVQGNYKDAFLKRNVPVFTSIMDEIFSSYLFVIFPDKVPVSVIICTRNRSIDLQRCLHSLKAQKSLPAEIIVVDNAPVDDSTRRIVEQFNNTVYILEERPGLSIARNTGIKKATSTIIAWIDDDVIVHPDWLYRVWEVFSNPNTVAMAGLVIASALETESQQIFEKHWSFNRGYEDKLFNKKYIENHLKKGPPVWEIGAGANMAFRRSIFDEVGYFDERLGAGASGCSEDSELWYRILVKEFTIHYNPRAIVNHEHRKELSALHKQIFSYMRGFAAAALFQQTQNQKAGYRTHLYRSLPKHYMRLLKNGFPMYSFRYRTLLSELRGLVAGVAFYNMKKDKPSQTHR
jgi:GT2 family glycosyltransferase